MINFFKRIIKYLILIKKFPNSKIYFGVNMDKMSTISDNTVLFANVVLQNANVDKYTYIQSGSVVSFANIGRFCSIANNVTIGLAAHPTYMVSTSPIFYDNTQPLPCFFTEKKEFEKELPTTDIESDVWAGQGALIKAGVQIGVGAVIGAGAVVTKDVEPYSIVAGVPAKHIKYRFEREIREKLIASKWWDFEEEKLEKIAPYFKNPQQMLEKLNEFEKYENA